MTGSIVTDTKENGEARLRRAVDAYLESSPFTSTVEWGAVGESGSAGKTTTVVTFSVLLAQLGFNVELVDLDGQGNLSKYFGIGVSRDEDDNLLVLGRDYGNGAYPAPLVLGDALMKRKALFPGESEPRVITLDDVRRPAYNEVGVPGYGVRVSPDNEEVLAWLNRIHVYPNGPSYVTGEKIDFYEDEASLQAKAFGGMLLRTMLEQVKTTPHFRGYDLHGTKSMSMMSALIKLKRAINCVGADDKTTGPDLEHLIDTIATVQEHNPGLELAMILPCRIKSASQRGNFGRKMIERLQQRHGNLVPDVVIRDAVTVSESYEAREPLPLWVPRDAVTDDYRHALAWALENGVFTVS